MAVTGRAPALLSSMKKWLLLLIAILLMLPLGAHVYRRCMAAGPELNQGQPFYVLAQGATANFVTRGTSDIHMLTYYVTEKDQPAKTSYALRLAFLTKEDQVFDQRVVQFSVTADETPHIIPDGSTLAQLRLLPLSVPANATIVRVTSLDGRILVRANQLIANHGSQEAVLERSGRPVSWFAADELQGLGTQGWATLPALPELPKLKLPFMAQIDEEAGGDGPMNAASSLRIEPHRALVFNVTGPGKMAIALDPDGKSGANGATQTRARFQIEHFGPRGSGRLESEGGRNELNLPAGPSSVILQPLSGVGATVRLETHKIHTLGRTDEVIEPAGRMGSAWRLETDKPVRFNFEEQHGTMGPLRLTAHALNVTAPGELLWRLLDENDQEQSRGTIPLSSAYDPFTAVLVHGEPADMGAATKIFLMPRSDTAALEVSAPSAVVSIEMLLEAGAEPWPLPPYDEMVGPTLRWHDVPVRSPRWIMLRPVTTQTERRQLYTATLRMPRMQPIGPLPRGPWVAVTPVGAPKVSRILERVEHLSPSQDIQTLIPTGQTTSIVLDADGNNARRVVLSCDVDGQLGGELVLDIDGHRAAKSAILTSSVRLEANAPAGVHRVRIDGAPRGRCTVGARPASGAITVRRSIYLLSDSKGLVVKVRPNGRAPLRVHYAIYSEGSDASKEAPFAVTIDGGTPGRRIGSSPTFTVAKTTQSLHFEPGSFPRQGSATQSALRAVAVSAVQLGEDLPAGNHKIKIRPLSSGRYWARFWIEGRRHRPDTAESFVTTDETEQSEVEE